MMPTLPNQSQQDVVAYLMGHPVDKERTLTVKTKLKLLGCLAHRFPLGFDWVIPECPELENSIGMPLWRK